MKRLSFMVSMAMLISCVASCDSGSDAVSYGVGTLSLGLSANPSFSTKTRSVNEAEYKKADNYQDGQGCRRCLFIQWLVQRHALVH